MDNNKRSSNQFQVDTCACKDKPDGETATQKSKRQELDKLAQRVFQDHASNMLRAFREFILKNP